MLTEVVCLSNPFTVIPMLVTRVQPVVAAGQLKPADVLIDAQQRARPGTLTVVMEPLYDRRPYRRDARQQVYC